ncbi:MAG: hypothetical protein HYY25_02510 [Candidatus Wallbacteria bacterium]|nr:hypothetical protein [Candidatus Wallbacteria bacterium]
MSGRLARGRAGEACVEKGHVAAVPPTRPFPSPFLVVGTALLDVRARTNARTPGARCRDGGVTLCAGGSGRNIAENLARLGAQVALLTVVGDDLAGSILVSATSAAGVDVSGVVVREGLSSGFFVALTGQGGQVREAVVDTRARGALDAACVRERAAGAIAGAGTVVAELALMPETLAAVRDEAARTGAWICFEAAACARRKDRLSQVAGAHLVKGNSWELCGLTNAVGTGEARTFDALARLLDRGARAALITLGAAGALLAAGGRRWRLRHAPQVAVDAAGAGDAFLAGFLDASSRGVCWADALRAAGAAGRIALGTTQSSPPELRREAVERLVGTMTVEEC